VGKLNYLFQLNLVVLVLAMRVAVTAAGQQKKSFMERVKYIYFNFQTNGLLTLFA